MCRRRRNQARGPPTTVTRESHWGHEPMVGSTAHAGCTQGSRRGASVRWSAWSRRDSARQVSCSRTACVPAAAPCRIARGSGGMFNGLIVVLLESAVGVGGRPPSPALHARRAGREVVRVWTLGATPRVRRTQLTWAPADHEIRSALIWVRSTGGPRAERRCPTGPWSRAAHFCRRRNIRSGTGGPIGSLRIWCSMAPESVLRWWPHLPR